MENPKVTELGFLISSRPIPVFLCYKKILMNRIQAYPKYGPERKSIIRFVS